ncbi:putative quinol monooxygenase [Exiguobacterium undae]|uniref:Antibiotic biosynthesis monooxygenase n=1 Tax=Exiguobacterium undae TaxID=169177 RepID=A0ABX2VBM1_9BACL|nr:putative quinol monooxygenase [Exiguobacterium undae]OAN15633.1 antibiotic biosynthesis monooxygenase [Exiguobacterium undae]
MIILIAQIQIKPGQSDAFLNAVKAAIAPSRAEAGCLQYTFHREADASDHFVFYEQWQNQTAFDAHIASDHYQTYRTQTAELVLDRKLTFLDEIL